MHMRACGKDREQTHRVRPGPCTPSLLLFSFTISLPLSATTCFYGSGSDNRSERMTAGMPTSSMHLWPTSLKAKLKPLAAHTCSLGSGLVVDVVAAEAAAAVTGSAIAATSARAGAGLLPSAE
eukprot:1137947-Pelagomonas_calceolata.AAC.3